MSKEDVIQMQGEVLEHLPKSYRRRFVDDLMRVTRRGVIFSCPLQSPLVEEAEQVVNDAYQLRHGQPHPFLREHKEFGLPSERMDSKTINRAAKTENNLGLRNNHTQRVL